MKYPPGNIAVQMLILLSGLSMLTPVAAQDEDDSHHEIDEVVVTASPLKRTVEQLAQPTTVLRGDDLIRKQSTSIGETVSQEPGVTSTYFGPVSSRPVIRGQYGERVRVLNDGLDALDASALSEDHQTTVADILAERIEIVRGPATLLYGSGAAGGIVNIVDKRITETPLAEPFSGAAAIGFDSATGKEEIAARIDFGNEHIAAHVDAFSRATDDVDIPGFAESKVLRELEGEDDGAYGTLENTDSNTEGGALSASWTGDTGFVGAAYSVYNSDYGVPGHAHEDDPLAAAPEDVRIDLQQSRIDLKGEFEFDGPLAGLRFRAAENDYTHTEFEGGLVGTVFDVTGLDSRTEFRHARFGEFEGALGIQLKRIDFNATGSEAFVPSSDTRRNSLFLFEEWAVNDAWVLQGSARFEKQEIAVADPLPDFKGEVLGASLGAIWRPNDEIQFSLNVALTERLPNATELYADGPHLAVQRYEVGSVTQGNGFLGKESSTNIDLTVHGDTGFAEWSVTVFANDADDYILLSPTALLVDELLVYEYNSRDVELYGAEVESRFELFDVDAGHLHLRLFGDFVIGREKGSGADLPRMPPARFGAGLHYRRDKLEAQFEAVFAAEQDRTAAFELPTDAYVLLDISASWQFDAADVFMFAEVSNLLDEDIRQSSSPIKDIAPLPGRSLKLGLRYFF